MSELHGKVALTAGHEKQVGVHLIISAMGMWASLDFDDVANGFILYPKVVLLDA